VLDRQNKDCTTKTDPLNISQPGHSTCETGACPLGGAARVLDSEIRRPELQ